MKCHVSVIIILTRAEVIKAVDAVLFHKPTENTCITKNGRKLKFKVSVNYRPPRPRAKDSLVVSTATRTETMNWDVVLSSLYNQK